MLEELIEVEKTIIGGEEVNSVDARTLYLDLGYSEVNFTTWMKKEMKRFAENLDFITIFLKKNGEIATKKNKENTFIDDNGTKVAAKYIITLDVAKHLAMKSDTDYGFKLREYFIQVEKVAKNVLGEKRLELEIKALSNKVNQDFISGQIAIAKQLQDLGANLDPIALTEGKFISQLPQGIGEAISNACSDIRTGVQVFSATHLLNENEIDMRPKDFNDAMIGANLMEKYFHHNEPYKKMVDNVNYYGYNRDASSVKKLPYQVRYYEDRFMQLIQLLRNEGYID